MFIFLNVIKGTNEFESKQVKTDSKQRIPKKINNNGIKAQQTEMHYKGENDAGDNHNNQMTEGMYLCMYICMYLRMHVCMHI